MRYENCIHQIQDNPQAKKVESVKEARYDSVGRKKKNLEEKDVYAMTRGQDYYVRCNQNYILDNKSKEHVQVSNGIAMKKQIDSHQLIRCDAETFNGYLHFLKKKDNTSLALAQRLLNSYQNKTRAVFVNNGNTVVHPDFRVS